MIKVFLLTGLWMIIFPIIMGFGILKFNKKGNKSVFLAWIIGLLLSFGVFELFAIPMIFSGTAFVSLKDYWFLSIIILVITSIILNIKNLKEIAKKNWEEIKEFPIFTTILVVIVIGFQCYVGYNYMHEDYDDSNFVAKATITKDTNTMFVYDDIGNEYKGFPDRQVLSPFAIYTSTIADFAGIHPAIMAHSVFPVIFLLVAYDVYYLLGNSVFKHDKKKTMLFLLFVALVYSFGDTTRYAASSRIILRPWQGKSILATIIIPFILYIFVEHVGKEDDKFAWLVLLITTTGAVLLSTMGVMLPIIELAVLMMLFTIKDSTFGYFYKFIICAIPNICYGLIYLSIKEDLIWSSNVIVALIIALFIVEVVLFVIRKIKFHMIFKILTVIAIIAFCAYSIWIYLMFINPNNHGIGENLDGEKYAEFLEEVGKEENVFVITGAFVNYDGTGEMTGIGYIAILFVIAYYLKNDNKDVACALGLFTIIAFCIPFNVYISKIIIKIIGAEVYWRMFWLVPTAIITAVAFTEISCIPEKRIEKLLIISAIVMFVSVSGNWIYDKDNFSEVSNKYKIPDHLLEVILAVSNDDEEYKKLAGPLEALVYTRQVDGNIKLITGRSFNDNYGKGSLVTNIKEGKVNKIVAQAQKSEVNYVIMSTKAINEGIGVLNERLEDYEDVEIVCKNDSYTLFKINLEEVEVGVK